MRRSHQRKLLLRRLPFASFVVELREVGGERGRGFVRLPYGVRYSDVSVTVTRNGSSHVDHTKLSIYSNNLGVYV